MVDYVPAVKFLFSIDSWKCMALCEPKVNAVFQRVRTNIWKQLCSLLYTLLAAKYIFLSVACITLMTHFPTRSM